MNHSRQYRFESPQRNRRRGTVMVMVVGLLGILLVVGVAFLGTMSFESQVIKAEKQALDINTTVASVDDTIRQALKLSATGNDGLAYNGDYKQDYFSVNTSATATRVAEVYGERLGYNPLISSVVPFPYAPAVLPPPNRADNWRFFAHTDLAGWMNDDWSKYYAPHPGGGAAVENYCWVLTNPPEANYYHANPADPNLTTIELAPNRYGLVDSNGDGVADTREYPYPDLARATPPLFPSVLQSAIAAGLRDPNFVPSSPGDENRMFLGLTILPHGGMVDMANSHDLLLSAVLEPGATGITLSTLGPYSPEMDEPALRRRFALPPPVLPNSTLHQGIVDVNGQPIDASQGAMKDLLLNPYLLTAPFNTAAAYRWWPINLEKTSEYDQWVKWMNPREPLGVRGRSVRPLLTTISHDDLLLRNAPDGADWTRDNTIVGATWQNYPSGASVPTALRGRMMLSLPELFRQYDLNALSVQSLTTVNPPPIDLILDGFRLMLENVHDDVMSDNEKKLTAAALTANVIDFADLDNDDPTKVDDGNGNVVFGVERQPYITEVFVQNVEGAFGPGTPDPTLSRYAIEIFNPYDTAISVGASYKITIDSTTFALTGLPTLAPQSYAVFVYPASGPATVTVCPGATSIAIPGFLMIPPTTTGVRLEKTLSDGTAVTVDRFQWDPSNAPQFGTTDGMERSVQRAVKMSSALAIWNCTIPDFQMFPNGSSATQTLGCDNDYQPAVPPVQVMLANAGDIVTAFPTTGSLLLPTRYAHVVPSSNPMLAAPANRDYILSSVDRDNDGTIDNTDHTAALRQIDNGRMPIFDLKQLADLNPYVDSGNDSGLDVPWGQLIFDYFTALPLQHQYDPSASVTSPRDVMPTVDSDGLRAYGRINVNVAPWQVVQGIPLIRADFLPGGSAGQLGNLLVQGVAARGINLVVGSEVPLGSSMAKAIEAYREERSIVDSSGATGNYHVTRSNTNPNDPANPWSSVDRARLSGSGFLTRGELANVRVSTPGTVAPAYLVDGPYNDGAIDFDSDGDSVFDSSNDNFVQAVSLLVAMTDWVTVKSNVFTVYGTLRGQRIPGDPVSQREVDRRAIRFQETLDRSPVFLDPQALPAEIGPRVVSSYLDAAGN